MRFREHQDEARRATRRLLWLFLLTVVLTVLASNAALALVWIVLTGNLLAFPRGFFETNSALCVAFVLGGSWLEVMQLRRDGARVAERLGARELLVPADAAQQRLRNVVQEMAIASGLKPPRIFLLEHDDAINAFAAGWARNDSVITLTQGALTWLDRDELQGVVAHEFAHILDGDTRLDTRLVGYVWGLQLLYLFGRDLVDATDARGRRTVFVPAGVALMAVGSLGWLTGRLLKAAVSRQREFLADAAAVQFTRQREGIGRALRKVAWQFGQGQARLHSPRAEVVSHMLLASNAFAAVPALATHPPLAERIRRIYGRAMAPLPCDQRKPGDGAPVAAPQHLQPGSSVAFVDVPLAADRLPDESGAAGRPASPPQEIGAGWLDDLLTVAWPADLVPATLAFLVPSERDPAHGVWQALFGRPGAAEPAFVLRQTWALPAQGRQPGFERLLTRCASLPREERLRLRAQAWQIVRADGRLDATESWHCLLLEQVMAPPRVGVVGERDNSSLQACAEVIGQLTDLLARQRFAGRADLAARRMAWCTAIGVALALPAAAPPTALASWPAVLRAVRQLARLAWSLRPQLLKAWCAVALAERALVPQTTADALRSLCILIDTPMPPALQACYAPDIGASAAACPFIPDAAHPAQTAGSACPAASRG